MKSLPLALLCFAGVSVMVVVVVVVVVVAAAAAYKLL